MFGFGYLMKRKLTHLNACLQKLMLLAAETLVMERQPGMKTFLESALPSLGLSHLIASVYLHQVLHEQIYLGVRAVPRDQLVLRRGSVYVHMISLCGRLSVMAVCAIVVA